MNTFEEFQHARFCQHVKAAIPALKDFFKERFILAHVINNQIDVYVSKLDQGDTEEPRTVFGIPFFVYFLEEYYL